MRALKTFAIAAIAGLTLVPAAVAGGHHPERTHAHRGAYHHAGHVPAHHGGAHLHAGHMPPHHGGSHRAEAHQGGSHRAHTRHGD
jgi:hypothetical protein